MYFIFFNLNWEWRFVSLIQIQFIVCWSHLIKDFNCQMDGILAELMDNVCLAWELNPAMYSIYRYHYFGMDTLQWWLAIVIWFPFPWTSVRWGTEMKDEKEWVGSCLGLIFRAAWHLRTHRILCWLNGIPRDWSVAAVARTDFHCAIYPMRPIGFYRERWPPIPAFPIAPPCPGLSIRSFRWALPSCSLLWFCCRWIHRRTRICSHPVRSHPDREWRCIWRDRRPHRPCPIDVRCRIWTVAVEINELNDECCWLLHIHIWTFQLIQPLIPTHR